MRSVASLQDPALPPRDRPAPAEIPAIKIAAFCETAELAETVARAAADRRMARAKADVRMGGVAAAVELFGRSPTPNLVIVESCAEEGDLFASLDQLAEVCLTSTKVLVVGHRNDVWLYRELLQRGVSDYVVATTDVMQLIAVIARLFRGEAARRLGKVCAFVGARGGAGSSTLAHNTAWAMAEKLGSDVLLADLDLPFGTVGLDFNVEAPQGAADAVRDASRLDEVLLGRMVAKRGERLSLLSPPISLEEADDLKENHFEHLIQIARSSAMATVLDIPHAWSPWVRRVLADADEIVITAAPDLANMRNAKALIEFARRARPNDPPPKLVLNQIGVPKRPEIKTAAFAGAVQLQPSVCIPFEPMLFGTAANNGQMIGEASAKSPVAGAFVDLARALLGDAQPKREAGRRGGIAARLLLKRA